MQKIIDETLMPVNLKGAVFAPGLAIGHIIFHEPRVEILKFKSKNSSKELQRLEKALTELRKDIDKMLRSSDFSGASDYKDVLEAYKMLSLDEGWVRKLNKAVLQGLTAEAAVESVQASMNEKFNKFDDIYLSERLYDLKDLSNRLERHLTGTALSSSLTELPKDTILLARNLGPTELLNYPKSKLKGLILEEGSRSSHTTIVARALNIPLMGRTKFLKEMSVKQNETVIIDGEKGEIFIRPTEDIQNIYSIRMKMSQALKTEYKSIKDKKGITLDGKRIELNMNAGLVMELNQLEESGADGIGLFRTELQFLISETLPKMEEQKIFYRSVLDAAKGKKVIFRTLDIGGDKILPYMTAPKEENPALGWRAIRVALDRPGLLRLQLRALIHASENNELSVMFPMIAEFDELMQAKKLLSKEISRMKKFNKLLPKKISIGSMLEIPSLIWQFDILLPEVDFISVGSNDLMQFLFAADRGNSAIVDRYSILKPSALRFLKQAVDKCNEYRVPIHICGDISGKFSYVLALLGLGFRSFSLTPADIGPIKKIVRSLHLGDLEKFMNSQLKTDLLTIENNLLLYAEQNNIILENILDA
ncbi:MAG: phosphoenolpyruvate--protein phosphotransferase [Pseudomonadota bacterium]|nr:phosphoenolpyruvate--protein phosphotransferase [Pseudomonadota bacterium]